jgi:segregation and condensation protein B
LDRIDLYIESLIFAAEKPISSDEIKKALESYTNNEVDDDVIMDSIDLLTRKYDSKEYCFQIISISNGYTFSTKKDFHDLIGAHLKAINRSKLTRASLETLAVIAYNQPATKPLVEQIRGVNSDFSIQKLLDKNLIEISGRDEGPGKPLLYVTTSRFLDHFGIKTIKDLPELKEFQQSINTVGYAEEE